MNVLREASRLFASGRRLVDAVERAERARVTMGLPAAGAIVLPPELAARVVRLAAFASACRRRPVAPLAFLAELVTLAERAALRRHSSR